MRNINVPQRKKAVSSKGFWHFQWVDIRARTFLKVKLSEVRTGRCFSEMNLFGHWVPSLLHFKAGRQAAFLWSCKILKKCNAGAISHHHNVCVCVHVVEYFPSTRQHAFLTHVTEKLRWKKIHTGSAMLYPAKNLFFFLHSSISWWNEAVLKGLFPDTSMEWPCFYAVLT